ncbi:MAG: D-alanine--(R)-lactate ligase, partial [Clostridia bacterium]|nr:D-alanine--(R)-lactate ligase [Clostridia bacterium]
MKKKVCVIFGGESTEYEISLKSAYSILQNINKDKYDVITIGITRDGKWYLYDGSYDLIPENKWYNETLRPVSIMHGCKKPSAAVFNGDSTYTKIDFD